MTEEGLDYSDVLKEAQDLGYAEADPSADVEGFDTHRKLRILSTMAFRQEVSEDDILVDGISKITADDIRILKDNGRTIKLIGDSYIEDNKIKACVAPVGVYSDSYFASVRGAFNSVTVFGDMVGELKFYGQGAGMLPTANAIINDIIDIIFDRQSKVRLGEGLNRKIDSSDIRADFYLRYDRNLVNLDDFDEEVIDDKLKASLIRDAKYVDLKERLEADPNSLIVRLEGRDY